MEYTTFRLDTIRLSYGTAITLGIISAKQNCPPTTAYLLIDDGCKGGCVYCSRSNSNQRSDKLSRVLWPNFDFDLVFERFKDNFSKFKRVCIQTSFNENSLIKARKIIPAFRKLGLPVSITLHPKLLNYVSEFFDAGVSHIGIGFDCATKKTYENYKKSTWSEDLAQLTKVIERFGKRIEVHLIYGLGDSEKDFVEFVNYIHILGGNVSLFAFTPNISKVENNTAKHDIQQTQLQYQYHLPYKQPEISSYRRIQLFIYLNKNNVITFQNCNFDSEGKIASFGINNSEIVKIIKSTKGEAFKTSGCSDCNRPFYNEKPGSIIYNYPRDLTTIEVNDIIRDLLL